MCGTDALVGPSHGIAGVSDPLFLHTGRKMSPFVTFLLVLLDFFFFFFTPLTGRNPKQDQGQMGED